MQPSSCEISNADETISLEPRVMQVLVYLSQRRGETVTRDDLIAACWRGTPLGVDDAQKCIGLAQRALATDSNDATVLAIAGLQLMAVTDDEDRGYGIVMRAFALNPNSFLVANFAGFAHRQHGNFDEAIICHLRALGFMPGAPEVIWCYTAIASAHLSAGRFGLGLGVARARHLQCPRMDPDYARSRLCPSRPHR